MKLTKSERMKLQQQVATRNGRADAARHARLILLLADGLTWSEIRSKLDCSDSYIDRWSKRFETDQPCWLVLSPRWARALQSD